jgi:hypothetical protein
MKKDFVIRGQTVSGETEILEFGGYKENFAYIMTEFTLYPSTAIGGANNELLGTVTAGKTAIAPTDPNFNNAGLIAVANLSFSSAANYVSDTISVVNDTFLITQNLILMVQDAASSAPVNWQCRFKAVKMTDAAAAVQNFKQFSIFDE